VGRDGAVQVRERLLVVEQAHFRKDRPQDVGNLGDALLKAVKLARKRAPLVGLRGGRAAVFVEESRRALGAVRRQLPREGQVVARLVVRAGLLEREPSLAIDDGRRGREPCSRRVRAREKALRLDEESPAGPQAAKRVVQARARREKLRVERAREVGPPEREGSLEDRVLLQDDARSDEARPRKAIGQAARRLAVFTKGKHRRYSLPG